MTLYVGGKVLYVIVMGRVCPQEMTVFNVSKKLIDTTGHKLNLLDRAVYVTVKTKQRRQFSYRDSREGEEVIGMNWFFY